MKTIKKLFTVFARRMFIGIVAVIIVMKPLPVHASTTIEHLQLMLNELGFDAGPADGISGPRTEAAVADFLDIKEGEEASLGFGVIEAIYDAYRAETGRTVFDIYGTESFEFGLDIKEFPATPYGNFQSLREYRRDNWVSYRGNLCAEIKGDVASLEEIGVLMGFVKPETTRSYRTVAQDDRNLSRDGMTARGTYTLYVQSLAMDYLLTGESGSGERLKDVLMRYANADAFRWYSGSTQSNVLYNDTYGLKTVYTPTISSWSVLRNRPISVSDTEKAIIDDWMWAVLNRVDFIHQNKPELAGNKNNQRYMLALNLMQLGLLYESEYFVHRALFEASKLSEQVRSDGSLPLETARGERAIQYTGHAVVSLVSLAEFASMVGVDLYGHQSTMLHEVVEFYLSVLRDPSLMQQYTAEPQLVAGEWLHEPIAPFCRRFPEVGACSMRNNVAGGEFVPPFSQLNMGYNAMLNNCMHSAMWSTSAFRGQRAEVVD